MIGQPGPLPQGEQLLQRGLAARMYAAAGLPIIPLRGKVPMNPGGVNQASTDPQFINRWWPRLDTGPNIGGRVPQNMIVIDIDPRNGGLDTWQQARRNIPRRDVYETLVTGTGSGGWHIWYTVQLNNKQISRGHLAGGPGVDIKTHKGYLVMPGSIHPNTGRGYQWCAYPPERGLLQECAPLPKELWAAVFKPTQPRPLANTPRRHRPEQIITLHAQPHRLAKRMLQAGEGERHATLRALAWAAACNQAPEDVFHQLEDAALETGLPEDETRRLITSALEKAQVPSRVAWADDGPPEWF